MNFFKQILVLIFIVCLLLSIYKDLSFIEEPVKLHPPFDETSLVDYELVPYFVERGETVLSIVEDLNKGVLSTLSIDEIIADFKLLNPETNIYELIPGEKYFFPKYK